MKYFFLLLFLSALPASASTEYTYLHCTGSTLLLSIYSETGKETVKDDIPYEVYLTLDEQNGRSRFGHAGSTWQKTGFSADKISRKNLIPPYTDGYFMFEINRSTGEFEREKSKNWMDIFTNHSLTTGICRVKTPNKF